MSEQHHHWYPSAFRYGVSFGVMIQLITRVATKEPLYVRPFSYLTVGLTMGFVMSYFDWWKRRATEEILYKQDENKYHNMVRAMNNVRVGEEEEITHMVEYLKGTSTRV
uniref:Uncharacterized protein n=1 Tax=Strombidium inclinatum TaxID=197538 RepID=A0A7S3IKU0_9SPIT|mmetsp:Transcript_25192/g.39021  ORF Transcript_25192/g.39021 Transcript_25192/m.39021 type:complete len:109 (+) Transcript_25192:3-329(+)